MGVCWRFPEMGDCCLDPAPEVGCRVPIIGVCWRVPLAGDCCRDPVLGLDWRVPLTGGVGWRVTPALGEEGCCDAVLGLD